MGSIFEGLKKYLESDECKKRLEEENKRELFLNSWKDKWIEKIHSLTVEQRADVIRKCIKKYDSDEYKDKEYKKCRFPENTLFYMLDEYAEKYGEPLYIENDVCISKYLIDGKFIIECVCGQGSVINVKEIEENEIVVRNIKDEYCSIYKPNGELLIHTNDLLIFEDIRLQISEKQMNGYYVIFHDEKITIDRNGTLEKWPNGLFDKHEDILSKLLLTYFLKSSRL